MLFFFFLTRATNWHTGKECVEQAGDTDTEHFTLIITSSLAEKPLPFITRCV